MQTRISRPPPYVHGKEGADGSSPSEGSPAKDTSGPGGMFAASASACRAGRTEPGGDRPCSPGDAQAPRYNRRVLTETQTYPGLWWLPTKPDEKFSGTLTITKGEPTLELVGHFGRRLISQTETVAPTSLSRGQHGA
jgi:ApeA N-terminal domain 1